MPHTYAVTPWQCVEPAEAVFDENESSNETSDELIESRTPREMVVDALLNPPVKPAEGKPAAPPTRSSESREAQPDGKPWWWSLGRLAVHQGGDLEAAGELQAALHARSWRGEFVLTYADEAGTSWAANLLLSLREVGIDHSLVITRKPQHCIALAKSNQRLSCGYSTWQAEPQNNASPPPLPRLHSKPFLLAFRSGR